MPSQYVYAYFPTLNPLRPWENYPFLIMPMAILFLLYYSISAENSDLIIEREQSDVEKNT